MAQILPILVTFFSGFCIEGLQTLLKAIQGKLVTSTILRDMNPISDNQSVLHSFEYIFPLRGLSIPSARIERVAINLF